MTDASPWATAVQDLQRAMERLLPLARTPDDQANLALIQGAVSRLVAKAPAQPQAAPILDAIRLKRLLELAGPNQSDELLARLSEDLTTCRAELRKAAAPPDWRQLRDSTHVLISLSGSIGALPLQTIAQALNAAAHAEDSDAVAALLAPLEKDLSALVDHLRKAREQRGPKP
jgi:HPt (histidine-containing phosphotransfer) domain-containing protein